MAASVDHDDFNASSVSDSQQPRCHRLLMSEHYHRIQKSMSANCSTPDRPEGPDQSVDPSMTAHTEDSDIGDTGLESAGNITPEMLRAKQQIWDALQD
ncbi:hypothetical protein FS749_000619, partial [Ceratobasidium sp. UAMH 11750]